jgi:hypothetical protein
MSALLKRARQIEHVELRAGAPGEPEVRDQHPQAR